MRKQKSHGSVAAYNHIQEPEHSGAKTQKNRKRKIIEDIGWKKKKKKEDLQLSL